MRQGREDTQTRELWKKSWPSLIRLYPFDFGVGEGRQLTQGHTVGSRPRVALNLGSSCLELCAFLPGLLDIWEPETGRSEPP